MKLLAIEECTNDFDDGYIGCYCQSIDPYS